MSQPRRHVITILVLILSASNLSAQNKRFPVGEWVKKLDAKSGPAASCMKEVLSYLKDSDSTESFQILKEIQDRGNLQNNYFKARFLATKAKWLFLSTPMVSTHEQQAYALLSQALNAAYETNNDSLISEMAWAYGITAYQYGKIEPAATYCLFAAELDNKIGKVSEAYKCWFLGDILYKTRDYQKALQFTQAAIQQEKDTSLSVRRIMLSQYNTIALCYQRMGTYDSAFIFYDVTMKMAEALSDSLWKGIVSGNVGQLYYLQKKYNLAKPLLFSDYRVCKVNNEQSSAANTLQWIARISLAEGKKDSALLQVMEALHLIEEKRDYSTDYYRQNIYATAVEVYRAIGNIDSVLKYSDLYNHIHDSLERAIADSRLEISRIKLGNIQNELAIKNLLKEKEAVAQQRNYVILVIGMLGIIAILLLNRQRQKLKHRQQLVLEEKKVAESRMQMAETERLAAKEQLDVFTQSLIEKSQLIEKLEQQLQANQFSTVQEDVIKELTQQTILTEADWSKFKTLFEKLYPGFFTKLIQQAGDITLAELRMAALIRLQLQPKQMASLLGISINSVYKTKQRLRQRFQRDNDREVEVFVAAL